MIATAIITAPRPRPTLAESLRSFRAAGFEEEVIVCAEPGVEPPGGEGVVFVVNEVKLGNLRNWTRALSLLRSSSEASWFMICEDDISWAAGAARVLEGDLERLSLTPQFRNVAAMSLYLPRRHSKNSVTLRPGWHSKGLGPGTWGFQCMIFTRAQADWLLSAKHFRGYLNNPKWDKNIDRIVGETILIDKREIMYRVPCLVNHDLGDENSSLGYRPDRPDLRTDYFYGPRA